MRTDSHGRQRTGAMNSLYLWRQDKGHLFIIALFLTGPYRSFRQSSVNERAYMGNIGLLIYRGVTR